MAQTAHERRKIAIVNQRYGTEVNGGSESYARAIAERLSEKYDVEVLTTCARDYDTWANYYDEGIEVINNVMVRRFKVDRTRQQSRFLWIDRFRRFLPFLSGFLEDKWVEAQGPYCPDFLKYIEENAVRYDAFLFVTYLYYLTAMGMPKVYDKSILIPTAHDEPYIFFKIYRELFIRPKGIIYLTSEEKEFVNSLFKNGAVPSEVAAIGIDVNREDYNAEAFRKKYGIKKDYVIYAGRVDVGKGCDEMFTFYAHYRKHYGADIQLVLLGKQIMDVPLDDNIVSLGFVSEYDKYSGISGAKALILPSRYESLSISVLEAMALGVPVIVNGRCTVLRGHCNKSGAGLFYTDEEGFGRMLNKFVTDENKRKQMGLNGIKYVHDNYNWTDILDKLDNIISL